MSNIDRPLFAPEMGDLNVSCGSNPEFVPGQSSQSRARALSLGTAFSMTAFGFRSLNALSDRQQRLEQTLYFKKRSAKPQGTYRTACSPRQNPYNCTPACRAMSTARLVGAEMVASTGTPSRAHLRTSS